MPDQQVFASERVVTPEGVTPAAIVVENGVIRAVESLPYRGSAPVHHTDLAIMPGIVDTHVHVNEPGRTEWEGFRTASRAAAMGGVTTLVDMPLNSVPVTTTVAALEAKRAAAAASCTVDYAFWGGVVPGNTGDLGPLLDAGVCGFKCFLVPSGIDEFPPVTEQDLRAAMPVLAARGAPLLVHAELPGPIARATAALDPGDDRSYARYLATRPPEAELAAIDLLIRLADATGCHTHVVHLATGRGVALIAEAQARDVPITVETCPHYLTFNASLVPEGATEYKCAPPIRTIQDREMLWLGLENGVIELIATDHSPCPPELKRRDTGDFQRAWGGIASLQLTLPITWTGTVARGGTMLDVARWLSTAPARLAGLDRKGAIAPGRDADLVLWDPEAPFTVDAGELAHRHSLTPYNGMSFRGIVRETWVRGVRVFGAEGVDPDHRGRWLR